MMWIILGAGLVNRRRHIIAIVQAIMVTATGIFGTHGLFNVFTYILPGLAVDLVMILPPPGVLSCVALLVVSLHRAAPAGEPVFSPALIPLPLSLSSAALSGGLGGIIAYLLPRQLEKTGLTSVLNRRG